MGVISSCPYCFKISISNLVDLSFEHFSFSSKRKTTILFLSPLKFLQLPHALLGLISMA